MASAGHGVGENSLSNRLNDLAKKQTSTSKANSAPYYNIAEPGVVHPDTTSVVKLRDNGCIDLFVSTDNGIRIDPNGKAINVIASSLKNHLSEEKSWINGDCTSTIGGTWSVNTATTSLVSSGNTTIMGKGQLTLQGVGKLVGLGQELTLQAGGTATVLGGTVTVQSAGGLNLWATSYSLSDNFWDQVKQVATDIATPIAKAKADTAQANAKAYAKSYTDDAIASLDLGGA